MRHDYDDHAPDCECCGPTPHALAKSFRVLVDVDEGDDGVPVVGVRTDLHAAPQVVRETIVLALGQWLRDVADEPIAKAADDFGPPRPKDRLYPDLRRLIDLARGDFRRFGDHLASMLYDLLKGGDLSPSVEAEVRRLLDAHEAAVVIRFAGVGTEAQRKLAIEKGFVRENEIPRPQPVTQRATVASERAKNAAAMQDAKRTIQKGDTKLTRVPWSQVDEAYRAGRALDQLRAAAHHPSEGRENVAAVVEAYARTPLNGKDVEAIEAARRESATYMRRPIRTMQDQVLSGLERRRGLRALTTTIPPAPSSREGIAGPVGPGEERPQGAQRVERGGIPAQQPGREPRELAPDESDVVRERVARAVEAGTPERQLARELREATMGTKLLNDMDRVASTELRDAHAWGGFRALVEQTEKIGIIDPEVYKLTSGTACVQCRRIWGSSGSVRYRLSQVEAWERAGGNFGLKPDRWGPTIGTVHPNCTCGPLLFFDPSIHAAMLSAAAQIVQQVRDEQRATLTAPQET